MRNQSHFVMLGSLAKEAAIKAGQQLGYVQQLRQQAAQQLNLLLDYQNEYHLKLNSTLCAGTTSASWKNYQQFIQTLEQAIVQQREQLIKCNDSVECSIEQWQLKRQRLNAYEKLHKRAQKAQQRHENCLEQQSMDEFAQRHHWSLAQ